VQGVYRVAADGALERDAIPYTQELRAEPAARSRGRAPQRRGVRSKGPSEDRDRDLLGAQAQVSDQCSRASWYRLSDRELKSDLRFAAQLRALGRPTPDSVGGRVIEGWIMLELAARVRRRRDVPAYVR